LVNECNHCREEQLKRQRTAKMEQEGIQTQQQQVASLAQGNTPNQDSFFQMGGLNGPPSNLPLVDIEIDKALSYAGKVSNEEFINEVQKIRFKVSHFMSQVYVVRGLPSPS
jgi:hypothetical protein